MEVVSNLFPARMNVWVDRGAQLFSLVYVAFIGWWGWQEAVRSFARNEVVTIIQTDLPMWPSRLLVPLGLVGMSLVILVQLVRGFRDDTDGPATDHAAH